MKAEACPYVKTLYNGNMAVDLGVGFVTKGCNGSHINMRVV